MGIEVVTINNESWFKIADHDKMRPFFMNIVSDSNHWMFISSNGGLSAGRKNNSYSLFPYYTDDKITESADTTGSKTILKVEQEGKPEIWEPFSERYTGKFSIRSNLYKSFYGNKILFEEINHDLGLTFRYQWNSSNLFGFVRKAELINHSGKRCRGTVLDGIQNLLPYGVEPDMQTQSSNLVDAYKKNELVKESGLGIYALSAIIVDKAEPSEALKANIAWSLGLNDPEYLLSSLQLDRFRNHLPIEQEEMIKGEKGAYFTLSDIDMEPEGRLEWKLIANVNQNHVQIIELDEKIRRAGNLESLIEEDIEQGTEKLKQLIAGADGLRFTADRFKDARHFSNVLFNIMRGGTFDYNYRIEKEDLSSYLAAASKMVFQTNHDFIQSLPSEFNRQELLGKLSESRDPDLIRLCREYLPLKFSRRHGDPSRPWNYFTINTQSELDGSKILDYEGNWRDIFQNWEALAHSYPGFIDGMVFKFLNNSTFDGYNPYRVTKGGFDWETIEPDDPWSYIGYWGDHQIIYLLKLLEFCQMHEPDALKGLMDKDVFVYANVPYRIKSFQDIAANPKDTILFEEDKDHAIRESVTEKGADGALLQNRSGEIHHVTFFEKILATTLSKISNFIPEGGIWMNTQRPEWNDANNALVGNGISMVTLCYLCRFLRFFENTEMQAEMAKAEISEELAELFYRIEKILSENLSLLNGRIDDQNRKKLTELLGMAGSDYRNRIYDEGFSGKKAVLKDGSINNFIETSLRFLEHSVEANRRTDDLFHSYNLLSITENGYEVSHLSEMLEGQVAILSSGILNAEESLNLLRALRKSALYREDQNSYILYPNRELPRFLEKNRIPEASVKKSKLLQKLLSDGNIQLVTQDLRGDYHFNGNFRNAEDVKSALWELKKGPYRDLAEQDESVVLTIFEEVFNHKAFTGRSGTFFAYEGLGSIYWHMVSKLHLATAEVCLKAGQQQAPKETWQQLLEIFYDIGEGIGIHKAPELYGAFPTDAYSHTPAHRGAQQPGMTGQVKEDILTSMLELGLSVENGSLSFEPRLLRRTDFRDDVGSMEFIHPEQTYETIEMPAHSLFFSICQVPVIYQIGEQDQIEIQYSDGNSETLSGLRLSPELSAPIFQRNGAIRTVLVHLKEERLN
ncbi:MAG: hypothetical protein EA360_06100 [Balneolaceae bacterium]|nr:MAG: hypothetical protein EA360_06100 [Balneolaceae bacterium]